ncbi:MAG: hypothetical protein ABL997_04845 [Planctomycetota bacterium]
MTSILRAFLAAALCSAAQLSAQACSAGDILLKNDQIPALPGAATAVAIVPGLCDGEAAMSVLTTSGPVFVNKVSAMFGAQFGTNGVVAAVDLEIYDGATVNAQGRWTLGPRVFQLSAGGSNLQIQSHAINEYTLPSPVRCTSGKVVIGWRMVLNGATGSCATGYTANFCTDFASNCTSGRNVLDAIGHGPIDPATYAGFGLPLCPIYFRGDWIIRACVTPDVSVTWTGNPTPGGAVLLNLMAPGHAGDTYLVMLSLGTQPGWNTPYGLIPLNNDFVLECTIDPSCWPALMVNSLGTLNTNSQGTAVLLIPNFPFLQNSGLALYAAFITSTTPAGIPFSAISAPSTPIVIN